MVIVVWVGNWASLELKKARATGGSESLFVKKVYERRGAFRFKQSKPLEKASGETADTSAYEILVRTKV